MARSLNAQIVRVMSALTLAAFAVMVTGTFGYYTFFYPWLYPDDLYSDKWNAGDFVVLGLILAISLSAAAVVAWRLAQSIVQPLKSVAGAVHLIAHGDFSARAETIRTVYGEAESLIADFNAMAMRLENAEAELKYSNSAIAHELRTPLTILRGRLQGLSDGVFTPSPELYGRLIAHVDDLARIVEDLRTLGLSNAGRLELKLDEIDLAIEVESVTASIEQDLAKAGLAVEYDLGSAVVVADRARIRQALFAILDNARRYAPRSTLSIQTRRARDRVVIRCTDDGPGLPPGTGHRAFERFWRADDSRARASGGSGLGLPVVQAIARAHGGDAIVTGNEEGSGLSIEIWLPAGGPA
ncbi:ATP-binding protein [Shinella sp. PSBB067]|uniref:ATP-binding protein n=1 Tax=Shinella sp. PSBB067 TaxID=2715959 RepID=UPI001E60F5FD|nr:ATP-binding protein [Shinella sp. PSBB067]